MIKSTHYAKATAIGCFITMFLHMGCLGTISLFLPQIIKELQVATGLASFAVTFASVSSFVCSLLVGRLIDKIGAKKTLLLATLSGVAHYMCGGLAPNIWFIFLGSILGGFTLGCGTQTCNAALIATWFPEKNATVLGMIFGGAALGSAVLLGVTGLLIDLIGWRWAYLSFGLVHLLVAIPINLLLIRENEQARQQSAAASKAADQPLGWRQITHSSAFILLLIAMVFTGCLIVGVKTFLPSYWQSLGVTPLRSSQYISVFMILSCIATMSSGTVADRFGHKTFVVYLHICFLAGMAVLLASGVAGATLPLLAVYVLLLAISYPLYGSIPATVSKQVFGGQYYAKICSLLMSAFYVGMAISSPIIGRLFDVTGTYSSGFTLLAVFAAVSLVLAMLAMSRKPQAAE